jgi:hypothetical protein
VTISNQFAADLLNLVFNGTAITGIAQNHGTPNATIFFSLHFDDPGEAGTQATNAASYTSYARVSRTRTNASGGMTAATATDPASTSPHTTNVDFPESTGAEPGGGGILDWFAVGETLATAGKIFWSGAVSPTITVAGAGVTPRLTTATAITLDSSWIATAVAALLLAKLGLFALVSG